MIAAINRGSRANSLVNYARRLWTWPLLRRSSTGFAIRLATVGFSFAASILFARALGLENYGIFVFWTAAAGMLGTLLSFGTPTLVMREIAAARGTGDASTQSAAVTYGFVMTASITAVLLATGLVAAGFRSSSDLLLAAPLLAFLVPAATGWASLQVSLLLAHEQIVPSQLLGMVVPVGTVVGAACLFLFGPERNNPSDALLVTLIAATIGFLASLLTANALVPVRNRTPASFGSAAKQAPVWLKLGILFALNQFLVNAITQIDILMLSWLSTPAETASYHVASRICLATTFFYGSVVAVTAPTIAKLHAADNLQALARFVRKASLMSFIGTAMCSILTICFGDYLVFLFGRDFSRAEMVMNILIIGWLFHVGFGLNQVTLTMTAATKATVGILAAAAILNTGLNAALIPGWGGTGAATASAVSIVALSLGFWVAVRQRYSFSADPVSTIHAYIVGPRSRVAHGKVKP